MKLEDHPFICSIADARRATIASEVEIITLSDGEIIFPENSAPDALFLILSGNVAFTKQKLDGSLQNVSQSGEGSFFGEVGVFTGEHRALGAVALGTCTIGRVPEPTVKKIIEDAEPVRRILESVIHHLKSTTDHYMDEVMRTEKLTLVGTMVSSLLHDFKNPFAIISLGSNIIGQRYKDDPKTAKICQNIESQIRRMVNMANDLAAFARGDSQIEIAYVSIDTLFEHFRELNTPFFKDQTVELLMQGNGTSLQGDASKLLRVLQNLISNSIEALHSADIDGQVTVTAEQDEDTVTITITDNGPGIPSSIRDNFFEPFVTQGKSDGTGLGTAIVQSIINAHRGKIEFETSAQGTTFTIRLPRNG
ncbi:ATP-binding protein [Coraliomargarita sp. SDUM461004]|uniref:histidine kinase n=1 Tax=Thalassobacterium sedimentorum TaxID=3041258 RepID=A0ABU1AJ60_9BACT|nr:ATP-binding protein [Coraliomargarita sp. SDUM461004]MDQ8194861.1 ATP-binding protein [Coraliomargarita sp. SDUM461004]